MLVVLYQSLFSTSSATSTTSPAGNTSAINTTVTTSPTGTTSAINSTGTTGARSKR